jgi:hypothetical protein
MDNDIQIKRKLELEKAVKIYSITVKFLEDLDKEIKRLENEAIEIDKK